MSRNLAKKKIQKELKVDLSLDKRKKSSFKSQAEILIVDDDKEFLDLVAKGLGKDFDILITTDGKKGLQIFKERSPDLVITDLFMPHLNGQDFINEMSHYSKIPIIVVSGYIDKVSKLDKALLDQHSQCYFRKPVLMQKLRLKIKELLSLT